MKSLLFVLWVAVAVASCMVVAPAGGSGPAASASNARLGSVEFLRGILFLAKSHRIALHWENGDFEIWDTERGRRVGGVERFARPAGFCLSSPDEATILTGDHLPSTSSVADLEAQRSGFIPMVTVWDARSGERKQTVQVPQANGNSLWTRDWFARWLDDRHALLVCLWRENPARRAYWLRLIVIDAASGTIEKVSEDLKFAGETVFLSPDRSRAVVSGDRHLYRSESGGVECSSSYAYSPTRVLELRHLALVSSWREPPDSPWVKDGTAVITRWCPDGKAVLTVTADEVDGKRSPKVRLWDAGTGRLRHTFSGHTDYVLDVAFTSAGDKLLTASEDRTIRVWDAHTGKLETVWSAHAAGLNAVAVLAGDKLAVSAAEEPVAKVWDLSTGTLKFELSGHDSAVRALESVSPTMVRTVTKLGTATTWNCLTGERLEVMPRPPVYPKRVGVCELVKEGNSLFMRIKELGPAGPKK
jgi:WD40 repeat protein